ncbi:MAG TPA: shikimate dehydrogenase, partial [Mycobacterium sp.]|nr:shikimate dehydrogenase [Mycobacterium sp.]
MIEARKAAVLGSPVAHSKSPLLHLAAYRALGLTGWTYDRIECTADQLPALVAGFGPEWVGVSVTMPGKFAALEFADERTERAELVGSANTLVRTDHGWRADNTDIDGVAGALGDHRHLRRAIVLGSGGTAPAAVVGLAEVGVTEIIVVARNRDKAARLLDLGTAVGVTTGFCELGGPG